MPVDLIGIAKSSQLNSSGNWTSNNDASVCADESPSHSVWSSWGASQRDLFILDMSGNVVFHQNVTSGIPDDLEDFIHTLLISPNDPCELGTIYVSEAHNSGDSGDYIEIFNSGETDCSLEGFKLDNSNEFNDLTLGNVTLFAGGYWLCYENQEGCFVSGLEEDGDEIWLSDANGNYAMVTLLPSVEMDGVSLSQSFDSEGTNCYTLPTPGSPNGECLTLSANYEPLVPNEVSLFQNYPNPFNPTTTISYFIEQEQNVKIDIYSLDGNRVISKLFNNQNTGYHSIPWDGKNMNGVMVSAGIYLYTLRTNSLYLTKKMILLK